MIGINYKSEGLVRPSGDFCPGEIPAGSRLLLPLREIFGFVAGHAAGIAIGALALIGNVEVTWSFSAFTVLIYYAITNLAALRLPNEKRLYPPVIAWAGLAACLGLAFFVEREIWMIGLGLIVAGLLWHGLARYLAPRT